MGIGNKNLILKNIKAFLISLLPYAEQQRIVAKVEQLLGICDALEAKLQLVRDGRQRLTTAVSAGVGVG